MTPALTLTLSAQAMTAVSAIIGQQMRLADFVIDQTVTTQRALTTPYFASAQESNAPVAKKKAAAPKVKAKVTAKAKTKLVAPKPKLVAETKSVVVKPAVVKATPVAPVAKVEPVKAAPVTTPVFIAKPAAPTAKAPVKVEPKAPVKAKKAEAHKAPVKQKVPVNVASTPAPKIAATQPKLAVNAKPAPRSKQISVPDAPWDGKAATSKTK